MAIRPRDSNSTDDAAELLRLSSLTASLNAGDDSRAGANAVFMKRGATGVAGRDPEAGAGIGAAARTKI
jgi:hypothetical protein